jgi:hypothetical protein
MAAAWDSASFGDGPSSRPRLKIQIVADLSKRVDD